jgi:hypothetical protein
MLTFFYITDVAVPPFDERVSQVLEPEVDGGGNKMVIAIENHEGKVYRAVETRGMGAYMHTVQALLDLGFTDTLADSIQGEGGFDSRMVPDSALLSARAEWQDNTDAASELVASLASLDSLLETERLSILKSRVGQGTFRAGVAAQWGRCAVSGAACVSLLKASHIKPWRVSSNAERLDPFNGLLLAPNLDSAFDAGLVTFDEQGRIALSPSMEGDTAYQLHINARMRLDPKRLTPKHCGYLEYHRQHVFRNA